MAKVVMKRGKQVIEVDATHVQRLLDRGFIEVKPATNKKETK